MYTRRLNSSRSTTNAERQTKRRTGISRRLRLGIAAALLAPAFPAAASAADYCVAPNTSCGGTNVATFENALGLAANAPDADRIFLGAATYTAPTTSGYAYGISSAPVEIVGRGEGQTVVTGPAGTGQHVLYLYAAAGSSLHDLTIRMPQDVPAGTSGLYTDAMVQRVEVTEEPTQANYRYGMTLINHSTVEDSTVTLAGDDHTTAVVFDGTNTVRRSALSAGTGVLSNGGTIERSRLAGSHYGLRALQGNTAISASVVRLTGSYGTVVSAGTEPSGGSTVTADGITIVSAPSPDIVGVSASTANYAANNASLSLTNSIIRGPMNALFANGSGSGHATVTASYSDYDPSGNVTLGADAAINEANSSNVTDAGFVDPAGGDYHLRSGSPLVDTGDPATPQGLDLDGNPLVADGNGDGSARRDMGAFELAPAVVAAGQPAAGAAQAASGAGAAADPLLVSGFMATPSVFAIAHGGTPSAARVGRGTHFHYTLSAPARVSLTIQHALAGRRRHGGCVRPTLRLRRARHCTRYLAVGTITRSAAAGANSTRFTGKLNQRALRPGSYRVVIVATDAAGNRSAPRRARFRIVRG